MGYVTGWARVRVWVPPFVPDQGLPPGSPGYPDQGLPGAPEYPDQGLPGWGGFPGRPGQGLPRPPRPVDPGWGVDEGAEPGQGLPGWGGFPERPGQGLPRPGRAYPIVPEGGDLGGHGDLPDLNMPGFWHGVRASRGGPVFPAWIVDPDRPEVEDDYEPRYPEHGNPGSWVTVLVGDELAWAWCPSPPAEEGEPGHLPSLPGEREPK